MICCLDVDYQSDRGQCAAVLFSNWTDAAPAKVYRSITDDIQPYVPGAFYKRELPCMLDALRLVAEPVTVLVIDGYVWLAENRGGLGFHLYEALNGEIPVVGVAKTKFRGVEMVAAPVYRGVSRQPLWVTAIGMDTSEAAGYIEQMAGEFRLPALLKVADGACREW
ncbi:MAG: endonuclease V [Saprospiraceae bacterium]|nr:endonuclease V [Saprospiraceae bacterium]